MNADIANAPGGIDIGSVFGEEDTLPLSTIAADMTQLVTSCRNRDSNNYSGGSGSGSGDINYSDEFDSNLCSVSPNDTRPSREITRYDSNFPPTSSQLLSQSLSLRGQPISQMQSFDTMASRVSAPNLLNLQEISATKSGACY